MRSTAHRDPNPGLVGLFWLGIEMVWGALLGVSLQARALQVQPQNALAAYGVLAAAGAATAAVTQIAVGILSDRRRTRGSRRIEFYITGAILASFALFWFYTAPVFSQLLGAVVLLQIAMNVAIGPYQALIPDFISEQRMGTASSWIAALRSVGNAAGAVAAGVIHNGRIVALALAAMLLTSAAATTAHVRDLVLLSAAPQRLRITRAFIDLFISRALVFVGFYTLLGYLYFYVAQTMKGDVKLITGIVLLVFTAAGAIGAAAAAKPSNYFDRRAVASGGGIVFVVALFAFLLAHQLAGIAVSAAIAGIAWGVFLTADWALGCHFMPRQAIATAMGVWNLALLIPQMVAPLLATAVLTLLHALHSGAAPRIAFILAACEVAAGVAWIWRLPAFRVSVETVQAGNTAEGSRAGGNLDFPLPR
jgi:MFS family permease